MSGVTAIIGGLFVLTLAGVLVIGPMLQGVAPGINQFNNFTLSNSAGNVSGYNGTSLVSSAPANGANAISCPGGLTGYSFNITVPLLVTSFTIASFNVCPPSGYNGNFIGDAIGQLGVMIGFILLLSVLALILGFVTGGESGQSLAAIGTSFLILALFIGLLGTNAYIFLGIPYIGSGLFALVAVVGGTFISLGTFRMLAGQGTASE